MATIQSKNFKATYLKLLTYGNPEEADYWAVQELIDDKYASGNVQPDMTRRGGGIALVLNFAPTVAGRLFADELAEQLRRSTWRYRLTQAAIAVFSFGGGWIAAVANQVTASGVTKWLGLG